MHCVVFSVEGATCSPNKAKVAAPLPPRRSYQYLGDSRGSWLPLRQLPGAGGTQSALTRSPGAGKGLRPPCLPLFAPPASSLRHEADCAPPLPACPEGARDPHGTALLPQLVVPGPPGGALPPPASRSPEPPAEDAPAHPLPPGRPSGVLWRERPRGAQAGGAEVPGVGTGRSKGAHAASGPRPTWPGSRGGTHGPPAPCHCGIPPAPWKAPSKKHGSQKGPGRLSQQRSHGGRFLENGAPQPPGSPTRTAYSRQGARSRQGGEDGSRLPQWTQLVAAVLGEGKRRKETRAAARGAGAPPSSGPPGPPWVPGVGCGGGVLR